MVAFSLLINFTRLPLTAASDIDAHLGPKYASTFT